MVQTRIYICVHCDLGLEDMTLDQGHTTLLGCGQQLFETLSIFAKGLRRYGPDKVDGQTDGRTDRQGESYIP